ncbi:MAG TPA: hypothetical protein VHE60_01255 [Pyrinomonadaceae bacterium]|nr:hypothetical protein [Pyrinomonadaceae bacterium]
MHLLAHGGMLPLYQPLEGEQKISPRKRGVKQGVLIFLLGVLVVPILAVFTSFAPGRLSIMFEFFLILAAILCFAGGPLRMLFAALFEEGAQAYQYMRPQSYAPPAIPAPARLSALPPPAANQTNWAARPQTAEILQPPSVTDSTTRLLEKPEPEGE